MVNINLMTTTCGTGYGVTGFNVLKELMEAGDRVALFHIGKLTREGNEKTIVAKALAEQSRFDCHAPSLKIWHQHALAERIGKGQHMAMPIFELDKLTAREKVHIGSCDHLFACSKWAKQVIEDNEVGVPCSVAPLGFDPSIFYPAKTRAERPDTVFFNAGKWEKRKGHDILPSIFNAAFTKEDKVQLWMMPHNPFLTATQHLEWVQKYRMTPMGTRTRFLPWMSTHEEVAKTIRNIDCGVFPSRAEGWNLEAIETLACGKHLIITDYSAHTEYANDDNAYLIKGDERETASDGVWFHGEGSWFHFGQDQFDQTVEHLRAVHRRVQEGDWQGKPESVVNFTWKNTVQAIKSQL